MTDESSISRQVCNPSRGRHRTSKQPSPCLFAFVVPLQPRTLVTFLILFFALTALHLINASTDDAFITFRYAENQAMGRGLVFNTGERVEGYSNFLFAQMLSLLVFSGLSGFPHGLLIWSKALGLLSGLLCVIVVYKAARLHRRGASSPILLACLAPILLCTAPQFIAWTVGGLETSFCALLVAMAQYFNTRVLLSRENGKATPATLYGLSAFFFLLASLTRPEIPVLFAAAFLTTLIYLVRHRIKITTLLPGVATYSLPYAGFIIWRYIYYGDIFPNTFYAKATGGGEAQFWGGLEYLAFGISTILGPFLVLCLIPLFMRARSPKSKAGAIVEVRREANPKSKVRGRSELGHRDNGGSWFLLWQLVAMSAFIIYSGGDWMGSYRLFVPIMPALVLMAQHGALTLWERLGTSERRDILRRWLSAAMIVTIAGLFAYHTADVMLAAKKASGFAVRDLLNREYYRVAKMTRERIRPEATVALGEAGLIPYYSKLGVIDMRGLTDRYIARLKGKAHAKFEPMYIFRRKPDYLLLVDVTGRTWSEHNYENMLLDHEVLNDDYRLVGGEGMFDLFHKYRFFLYSRRDALSSWEPGQAQP